MSAHHQPVDTVERRVVLNTNSGEQVHELIKRTPFPRDPVLEEVRREMLERYPPSPDELPPVQWLDRFITLQSKKGDMVLRYEQHQAEGLEADWQRLLNEPDMSYKEFHCSEVLQWSAKEPSSS